MIVLRRGGDVMRKVDPSTPFCCRHLLDMRGALYSPMHRVADVMEESRFSTDLVVQARCLHICRCIARHMFCRLRSQ